MSWEAFAALTSALGTFFAGFQIYQSRRESIMRTTFERIEKVIAALAAIRPYDRDESKSAVLDYYRNEIDELSPAGEHFMCFMEALDLLAMSMAKNLVDRKTTLLYLESLFDGDQVDPQFVAQLQETCKSDKVLRYLQALLNAHKEENGNAKREPRRKEIRGRNQDNTATHSTSTAAIEGSQSDSPATEAQSSQKVAS